MEKTCPRCNKIFNTPKSRQKYCSRKCFGAKRKTICPVCKKLFNTYRKNQKYCSTSCFGKAGVNKGKHHSEAHKANISKTLKRIGHCPPHSPEINRKISNSMTKMYAINSNGYIHKHLPKHPYATKSGKVLVHRLIMEKHLGRYLKSTEVVHHINENRQDNRLSNLMLFPTRGSHRAFHLKVK